MSVISTMLRLIVKFLGLILTIVGVLMLTSSAVLGLIFILIGIGLLLS